MMRCKALKSLRLPFLRAIPLRYCVFAMLFYIMTPSEIQSLATNKLYVSNRTSSYLIFAHALILPNPQCYSALRKIWVFQEGEFQKSGFLGFMQTPSMVASAIRIYWHSFRNPDVVAKCEDSHEGHSR